MKNNCLKWMLLPLFFIIACKNDRSRQEISLIANNPLSYTDVVFCAEQDTVLVSTYSGRIAKRVKNQSDETAVFQAKDEIYSLEFDAETSTIYASTLSTGILVINETTGQLEKTLILEDSVWLNHIGLSQTRQFLFGFDTYGNNHVWDIRNDYSKVSLPESLAKGYIRFINADNDFYFQTNSGYLIWNPDKDETEALSVTGRLTDSDQQGHLLLLNYNEFLHYNQVQDSVRFRHKHPYYVYRYNETDTTHIPAQLKLTEALYGNRSIYTAGLDKSIRVWDKSSGNKKAEWLEHDATISAMAMSKDKSQLASVDLKGGLHFWDS